MSQLDNSETLRLETEFDLHANIVKHPSHRLNPELHSPFPSTSDSWRREEVLLGSSIFGPIHLERCIAGESKGHCRAVKRLCKADMDRSTLNWREELSTLTRFADPNFVKTRAFVEFLGWFDDDQHVYLAMEYISHGTLNQYLTQDLTEADARIIATQLFEAVNFLHKEHFSHGDIKPQNIFVVQSAPHWQIKLGDFGMSKRISTNTGTYLGTRVGSPPYLAPEISRYVYFSEEDSVASTDAADVWSVACVVYEMLSLYSPFPNWPRDLVSFCSSGLLMETPLLANHVSSLALDFVRSTIVSIPRERPSASTALGHAWFGALTSEIPSAHRSALLTSPDPPWFEDARPASPNVVARDVAPFEGDASQSYSTVQQFDWLQDKDVPQTQEESADIGILTSGSHLDGGHGLTIGQSDQGITSKVEQHDQFDPFFGLLDEEDTKDLCQSCRKLMTGRCYRCTICHGKRSGLCSECVGDGQHCYDSYHWLVERDVHDDVGTACGVTTVINTGWRLLPLDGQVIADSTPREPVTWRRGRRSTKRSKHIMLDYCHHCRTTFPIDEPPPEHESEQHCTEQGPAPEQPHRPAPAKGVTMTWRLGPDADEIKAHNAKLIRMADAMQAVFGEKVGEKEGKLRAAEKEMLDRYAEMKNDLSVQKTRILERKAALEKKSARRRSKLFGIF